jgi:hypothetical protein
MKLPPRQLQCSQALQNFPSAELSSIYSHFVSSCAVASDTAPNNAFKELTRHWRDDTGRVARGRGAQLTPGACLCHADIAAIMCWNAFLPAGLTVPLLLTANRFGVPDVSTRRCCKGKLPCRRMLPTWEMLTCSVMVDRY